MSNCLYANYLAAKMENLSPRGEELVNFGVSVRFCDNRYTVTAYRDDCRIMGEHHADTSNGIVRAILGAVRTVCGYRSSYWSCAKYSEVSRNLMTQLRPYLPDRR